MINVDKSLCNGCGDCARVCPHAAIAMAGNPPRAAMAAPDLCMECGACGLNCPQSAITGNFGVACFAQMTSEALTGRKSSCTGCGC